MTAAYQNAYCTVLYCIALCNDDQSTYSKSVAMRLVRQRRYQHICCGHRSFLDNYRTFQRICRVPSLTLVLDVIIPLVRLAGRLTLIDRQFSGFVGPAMDEH